MDFLLELGDLDDGNGSPSKRMSAQSDVTVENIVYITRKDVPTTSVGRLEKLASVLASFIAHCGGGCIPYLLQFSYVYTLTK